MLKRAQILLAADAGESDGIAFIDVNSGGLASGCGRVRTSW